MRRATIALVFLALFALVAGCSSDSERGNASGGEFIEVTVAERFTRPTDFAFAPDGRIFVAEQAGTVRVFKNGAILPEPFIQLTVNVHHERGLLGLALDPRFESNGYVYLYYVNENSPDVPDGPKTAQLLRVTADGDRAQAGSELVLLGSVVGDAERPSCYDHPAGADCIPADEASHNGGGIAFTPSGEILLALGDAEQFLPAQDLDYLGGKLVRINRDGSAPEDNPFYDGPDASRSKVWSLGLRNPFTLVVRPGTDAAYIGDVGSTFEEINVGAAGANFGWPCFSNTMPELEDAVCDELVADGRHALPLHAYERMEPGAAVVIGAFYLGGAYPDELDGAFLFGDFVMGTISSLRVDDDNAMIEGSLTLVYDSADSPVDFEIGPGGDLYYLSNGLGSVQRLCFVEGDAETCQEDGES